MVKNRAASQFKSFAQDCAGSVMMMFGLMAIGLFLFIGGAVDLGRWLNARDATVAAVDTAVLASGRALQTNGGDEAEAKQIASTFYAEAVKSRLKTDSDSIQFVVSDDGLSVTAEGNAYIKTPFMSLAGVMKLPLLVEGGAEHSKAQISAGSNSDRSVETALMLDVSGSMSGEKIEDLKAAATDLINIIVWDSQGTHTSKVALIPFSSEVRPPASMLNDVAGVGATFEREIQQGWKTRTVYYAPAPCVAERGGEYAYTDHSAGGLFGSKVSRVHMEADSSSSTSSSCRIHQDATVLPLTNDKDLLRSHIGGLVTGGGTAGHIGTAWSYYMLSPSWASVVGVGSRPDNYGDSGAKKIAILMSDGEYNYTFEDTDDHAVPTGDRGGADSDYDSVNGATSAQQAVAVCQNMKRDGIEVYTVGFALGDNQTAIQTLEACATDPSKVFNAANGDELRKAFREIALQISDLFLSR